MICSSSLKYLNSNMTETIVASSFEPWTVTSVWASKPKVPYLTVDVDDISGALSQGSGGGNGDCERYCAIL